MGRDLPRERGTTMTIRELYNATIKALNTEDTAALRAEYEALLEKMDTQAATRRTKAAEKAAEKRAEKAPIRDALLEVMGSEDAPKTASMLIEEAGLTESLKPASVPSLLKPLVDSGIVLKVDMKIPGKGTQRGYVKA